MSTDKTATMIDDVDSTDLAHGVHATNDVYKDPPGHVVLPLDAHTTAVVEAAEESREEMIGRLFNYAKPSDVRRGVYRIGLGDETLRDRSRRILGHD